MVNNKSYFTTFTPSYVPIVQADGSSIISSGYGDIGPLKNILYVEKLQFNLLSISYFTNLGFTVIFNSDGSVQLTDKSGTSVIIGNRKNNLFYSNQSIFDLDIINPIDNSFIVKNNSKFSLWHRRFVHINAYYISKAVNLQLINGIQSLHIDFNYFCHACALCKSKRKNKTNPSVKTIQIKKQEPPYNVQSNSTDRLKLYRSLIYFSLVKFAADLKGPLPSSIHKNVYCLLFTSCITRYRFVYFLILKSDTINAFKHFILHIKKFHLDPTFIILNQEIQVPLTIKTDNGGEFVNNDMSDLFLHQSVTHEKSSPYSPFQNGIAERSNRTIFELASTIMTDANIPLFLWEYAVRCVVYVLNLLPNKALNLNSTPYEQLFGRKPNVSHLRIFGCPAYVLLQEHERPSFGVHAFKSTFVGYDENSLSYLFYFNHSIYKSRDVIFNEAAISQNNSNISSNLYESIAKLFGIDNLSIEDRNQQINELNNKTLSQLHKNTKTTPNNNNNNSHPMLRRSQMNDSQKQIFNSLITLTSGKFYINIYNLDQEYILAIIIDESDIDPNDPNWIAAMDNEIQKLIKKPTWMVVDTDSIPPNQKPLKYKWVYSKKVDIFNQNIFKARLTVKGCSQIYGIDFKETYSPVAQITTFRLILSLCVSLGFEAYQMDVQNAFPNATLNNVEIYMVPPPQLNLPTGKSLKLLRALYGLKQASREWFLLLSSILTSIGFNICKSDSCLFYLMKDDVKIIVVDYVDDMLVVSNNFIHIQWLHKQLSQYFIINMVKLHTILGFNVNYDIKNRYLKIDKNKYTKLVLEKFKHLLQNSNTQLTPIDPTVKLKKADQPLSDDDFPYRSLIGCFSYLAYTFRADISFPTNLLARFMDGFDETHIVQSKKLLRYLSDHSQAEIHYCDLNIHYKYFIVNDKPYRMLPQQLYVFVDSDWASSDLEKRRSTTGYLIFYNGGLISWRTCLQRRTATSSTEAEYLALHEAIKESIWIKHILEELSLFTVNPIIIFEDNNSTINASYNPVEHSKLKHLDIIYHSIRDFIQSHDIIMQYINTPNQLADNLTKTNTVPVHQKLAPRYIYLIPSINKQF